ncbi:MAG: family 20 glycosylhydrolase [Paramuribaculum sp.]|nr:family 20 glycosylhydrolase [Paramuribaculum sp.]
MLDVSRHFFSAEQIKKMLRLLAAYKMNKFHWHLTDDQGWRLPVKEYPLLTTVGASHPANTRMTDFSTQTEYFTTGPSNTVAYTAEEIRDVVDYASKLNIDIIPEIEMPGHLAAAIAAYPHLSCYPDSAHAVRDLQGISKDVLDVSNPEAMKFVKTVIDCLVDFFPYDVIHIGGDETPTEAWEQSVGCRRMVEENGFTGTNQEEKFRKLQNLFTYEVNEYAKSKGRRLMTWDEVVTAPGADLEIARQINPMVMADDIVYDKPVEQCADLGLQCVYTPFGPYYINRRYNCDNIGAGHGRDDIEAVYNHPVPDNPNVIGTQAIFWTEFVSLDRDLEYLTLPRLAAIAENAWIAPSQKDFPSFQERIAADTEWLNLAGYNYAGHQISTP